MFGKNKEQKKGSINQKELMDREMELYKQEKILEIEKAIEDYRFKRQSELQDIAKRCLEELAKYEHTYHYAKEQKGIEIAQLQAKIEALDLCVKAREEVVKADQHLIDSKNAEIKRLNEIITLLINSQSHERNSNGQNIKS